MELAMVVSLGIGILVGISAFADHRRNSSYKDYMKREYPDREPCLR